MSHQASGPTQPLEGGEAVDVGDIWPADTSQAVDHQLDLLSVFDNHYVPLLRLAFTLSGDQDEAEDLVQDAFLDLQLRWKSVLNPLSYLRRAVVNGARRKGRQRTNRRRIVESNLISVSLPATSDDWVNGYLTDAIAELPDRYRFAVVLAYYGQLTSNEIAEVLDCRPSTARSLVRRGLTKLRKALEA